MNSEPEETGGEEESHSIEIVLESQHMGGVWANFAQVTHSEHEFTIDFVRMDYSQGNPPRRGIVVARVAVSPLFITQLIDALNINWRRYAEKSMPKEVRGDE